MKRTFATTTLAVGLLLGTTACKGGGAAGDSAKLIPEAATVVGGLNLKSLVNSGTWKANEEKLKSADKDGVMEAAKACNLGPSTWKSIVFGADPSSNGKMVAVISVDGVGKKENLECINKKAEEKGEKMFSEIKEEDGKVVVVNKDGDGKGWARDANTLVIAGKDWEGAVKELMGGKGKSAMDGPLKDVIARTNTSKTVWGAGNIPESMASGPIAGAKNAAGSIDFSSGLGVDASVAFGSADDAKAKAEELQKQFDAMKGMAGSQGVPEGVTNSVKIEAKGDAVHVSAKASDDDVKKMSESVSKMMGM